MIYKAYETRIVALSTVLRDAVMNAISNAQRKKGKRLQNLWKKKRQKADMESVAQNLDAVKEAEKNDGKDWVRRIYEKNGLKPPKGV